MTALQGEMGGMLQRGHLYVVLVLVNCRDAPPTSLNMQAGLLHRLSD